ncbi:Midasin, partial [Spraguea lophii 42_110]
HNYNIDYKSIIDNIDLGLTTNLKYLIKDIIFSINNNLPVLLIGDTGTGKTTLIQQIHNIIYNYDGDNKYNNRLLVYNISADTELSDLIGSYKSFDVNNLFNRIEEYLKENDNNDNNDINDIDIDNVDKINDNNDIDKINDISEKIVYYKELLHKNNINIFNKDIAIASKIINSKNNLYYSHSMLIEAMENGYWILLDEINLCNNEVLQALDSILDTNKHYNLYNTNGDDNCCYINIEFMDERIRIHPNFRVFATMNPEGIGKKDFNTKTFTKIYCDDFSNRIDDIEIVTEYILKKKQDEKYYNNSQCYDNNNTDEVTNIYNSTFIYAISQFYYTLRKNMSKLYGYGKKPLISGRTYCRVLKAIQEEEEVYKIINLLILTQLEPESKNKVVSESTFLQEYRNKMINGNKKDCNRNKYSVTTNIKNINNNFIITPEIYNRLCLISTAIDLNISVLLEGSTSTGKTSILLYLANLYDKKIIRINNHENTDSSDYIGRMIIKNNNDNNDGENTNKHDRENNNNNVLNTQFMPGPLFDALTNGHWLLLDELNLCSSEVLELLNSVLDDNKSLYVPFINKTIKAHKDFRLFGTQNSALYGGRKQLSEAFRNRFVEINFGLMSLDEIKEVIGKINTNDNIINTHNNIQYLPTLFVNIFMDVYKMLSSISSSYITLRDLFKWVYRSNRCINTLYYNGKMVFINRIRENKKEIENMYNQVFFKHNKNHTINFCNNNRNKEIDNLYDMLNNEYKTDKLYNIIYNNQDNRNIENNNRSNRDIENNRHNKEYYKNTKNINLFESQKILLLNILISFQNNEPILIVGDTGMGKTKVCEIIKDIIENNGMEIINLHANIEASDLIGQYTINNKNNYNAYDDDNKDYNNKDDIDKNKYNKDDADNNNTDIIFRDGVVTRCIRKGKILLLDEINLCSDSVIERINSILEVDNKNNNNKDNTNSNTNSNNNKSLFIPEINSSISIHSKFRVIATMNPGNDHGKKELSPALRNRFTEIWYEMSDEEIKNVYENMIGNFYYSKINDKLNIRKIELIRKYILYTKVEYNAMSNDNSSDVIGDGDSNVNDSNKIKRIKYNSKYIINIIEERNISL